MDILGLICFITVLLVYYVKLKNSYERMKRLVIINAVLITRLIQLLQTTEKYAKLSDNEIMKLLMKGTE